MRYNIGVLAGDGIGPEIVAQARKVLDAVAKKFNHQFEYTEALVGASAIDEVGDPFPQKTLTICLESDAVLFGAIGDPRYDNDPSARVRPEQGLLAMRKQLGLYANIRPVKAFEKLLHKSPLKEDRVKGVDFTVVRELTGGLYFGQPQGRTENGETAFDSCVYSKFEIERICRKAFELAMQRRKKLTVVDKANVLATSRLWRETAQGLEKEYPEVETSYLFVDNAAMQLIQNPAQFDVMVTENMFGDILTDEASVITGSLGLLPSASVGEKTSVFEPIHGSYPQAAGKDIANPLGTVLSAALLLEAGLGLKEEAACIEEAVNASLEAGYCTEDINAENPKKTSEVGDWLANHVLATCECEGES